MDRLDSERILVSVIVPLYNVADILGETLDALVKQSLYNVEFLLIDDGSSDGTYDVALRYAQTDPRIRVFRQDNAGPAAARNHGLRMAKGEYICFVDSDDILAQRALEIMYDAGVKHNADLVTGITFRFDSKRTWPMKAHIQKGLTRPGEKTIAKNPELFYSIGPCAKLYRRDLVEGVYFPEHIRFAEDQPFVLHAYLNARRIYTVDAVVYYYRVREGEDKSLTQSIGDKPLQIIDDIFRMLEINQPKFSDQFLYSYYLERVVTMELWPAVRAAIVSGGYRVQKAALKSIRRWLGRLDTTIIDSVPAIRYFFIRGIMDRFLHLSPLVYKDYLALVEIIIRKMSPVVSEKFRDRHRAFYCAALQAVSTKTPIPLIKFAMIRKLRQRAGKVARRRFFLRKVVFGLSKMIPVNEEKVVLASNKSRKLNGNLKRIYEYIFYNAQLRERWRVEIFLNKERTLWQDICLYYHLATARVIVLDDYYRQLYGLKCRRRTRVVQSWHACGAFKKFGFSAEGYLDSNSRQFEEEAHTAYTDVIVSGTEVVKHFAEAFNVPAERIFPIGVPRTDELFDDELACFTIQRYRERYRQLRSRKVILYAPTFRGSPKERKNFKIHLNWDQLSVDLGDDYAVLVKLHPSVVKSTRIPSGKAKNIIDVSNVSNINELLMIADVLVTDYSSVIFEFALLNKPIVFYAYDLETYALERGFYYDYSSFAPGPIVFSQEELVSVIREQRWDLERVSEFRSIFFDKQDGLATERFIQHVMLADPPYMAEMVNQVARGVGL
ncbi:MAG: CDP-glycerol:glycerophosphate glycerophosphotransferase [Alicyclobacillus herbarius]|uniref:bifunctional glycosyltransferase/CDP-glycerol:glycerophosphate glycerophosphotransferase n=1 Tax=Alicyclobacillus herbarius TaxID=122960 RepID=UPI002355D7D1|nr:CDP-glycerol:glycerophosphate glycerophosphotransferase [Alicyclobacillus herbarius]MCL6631798.1 CDP-glycerol:glycerophosphate glycerophosphotransferase [Alicyclobacillus herbarius]